MTEPLAPHAAASAIDVDGLDVRYGEVHALHDVHLDIPYGHIAGLIGMNGSGKSTLFKSLTGAIKDDGATVRGNINVESPAYVPQSEHVNWNFPVNVRDVVAMGRRGHQGAWGFRRHPDDKKSVDAALRRSGLADLADRQIGQLSGGQKKRAFVARGIAQQARTILLDEPFAGVDTVSQETISTLLRELADEGCCILLATHDLGSIKDLCDSVIMLKGTVVAHGTPESTMTTDNVLKTFGIEAGVVAS